MSSLRDPASFGPPPQRHATGSSAGIAPQPTSRPSPTSSFASPSHPSQTAHAAEEAPAPPKPYRVDTTGLSTAHLPPPPVRRDGTGSLTSPPPPYTPAVKPAPPSLPPRLPPRANAGSPTPPTRIESPTGPGLLNQGAINRLGAAGISVPGLGIGSSNPSQTTPAAGTTAPQVSELQSRFSRLGASSPSTPEQGTTLGQKRAALQTAAAFQQNPGSVSASDARAAASTVNNFRQRHGDQVAAGLRGASNLHDKYGGHISQHDGGIDGVGEGRGATSAVALPAKKKPPPPPPKKPMSLNSRDGGDDAPPPPIPLASRPQF